MSLLEVRGLEVFFDLPDGELHAVQGVDLSLNPGERLGIVGESGSGKTTTILALMGLLPPTASVAGEVRLSGRDLLGGGERGCDEWRWSEIATVFQGAMNAFNPVRTVGWQIAEPVQVHGTAAGTEAKARTRELLALVGLPPAIEQAYPHELSGGMRQRAAIAMALACQPRVLLADEPTTALDVVVQDGILKLLTRLSDELGLALVFVSHDLAAASATCRRIAVMYAGRVVEEGPVSDIRRFPSHPYTRQLFAATPDMFDGRAVTFIRGLRHVWIAPSKAARSLRDATIVLIVVITNYRSWRRPGMGCDRHVTFPPPSGPPIRAKLSTLLPPSRQWRPRSDQLT